MKHKPGSLEEVASHVLLNELASPEIRKRGRDAVATAIDAIDKLRDKENRSDILAAYNEIIHMLSASKPLIAKTIRVIETEDEVDKL